MHLAKALVASSSLTRLLGNKVNIIVCLIIHVSRNARHLERDCLWIHLHTEHFDVVVDTYWDVCSTFPSQKRVTGCDSFCHQRTLPHVRLGKIFEFPNAFLPLLLKCCNLYRPTDGPHSSFPHAGRDLIFVSSLESRF